MTPNIAGIAGFGLLDTVFHGHTWPTDSWRMADVLLAMERGGTMRFGREAAMDRACCGFFWPPEAILELNNLRRAPVPALWRALVDAADTRCMWKTRAHGETPVARMLAGHLHHLYSHLSAQRDRYEALQPVICIPNKLDERGQDDLLKELQHLGTKGTKPPLLLWRPVAAALAWLNSVESAIRQEVEQGSLSIGVIYLGPDSIEMTRLEIKLYTYEGKTYVLPRRSRPTEEPEYTGMDWAGNLLQTALGTKDNNSFWQCFGAASGLWKSIAEYTAKEREPHYYNSKSMWHQWNPVWRSPVLHDSEPVECATLRTVLGNACPLKQCSLDPENLEDFFVEATTKLNRPRLHSLIVCGPLAGHPVPPWLEKVMSRTNFSHSTTPTPGKIWLAPGNAAIAEGAAMYGQKCDAGIPAYLDTLPPLSLLADKEHDQDFEWCPLFKEREVLGGHEAQHTITDRFALKSGSDTLHIWLSREEHENTVEDKPSALNFAMERIIRAWVRRKGSLAGVKSMLKYIRPEAERAYAITYAQKLFGSGETGTTTDSETPYREAGIQLETIPKTQIPLDVHVKMKPAAGLARVEFVPKQEGVFQKQRIRLDFDKMKPNLDVPRKTFGWPGLQEILVHPDDTAWVNTSRSEHLRRFVECSFFDNNSIEYFNDIKNKFFRSPHQYPYNGDLFVCMPIGENGKLCTRKGQSVLDLISKKISRDIDEAHPIHDRERIVAIITRASWLYVAAPEVVKTTALAVVNDAESYMKSEVNKCTEAAARMFEDAASIQQIFASILNRCNTNNQGPNINAIRAALTMFKFRSVATDVLEENQYTQFFEHIIAVIRNEANKKNFEQTFYQGILLLLYLLRIRKRNPSFCAKHSAARGYYEKAIELIQEAVQSSTKNEKRNSAEKNRKALGEFKSFVDYKATADIPSAITELAGKDESVSS